MYCLLFVIQEFTLNVFIVYRNFMLLTFIVSFIYFYQIDNSFLQASQYRINERAVEFRLQKKGFGEVWPRLTYKPIKHPWLKIDFDKFAIEEDSDEKPDFEVKLNFFSFSFFSLKFIGLFLSYFSFLYPIYLFCYFVFIMLKKCSE